MSEAKDGTKAIVTGMNPWHLISKIEMPDKSSRTTFAMDTETGVIVLVSTRSSQNANPVESMCYVESANIYEHEGNKYVSKTNKFKGHAVRRIGSNQSIDMDTGL